MENKVEQIGDKIAKLRKFKGISQERLSELVGVSRTTIYKWESNYVQPNAENIKILCKVFEVEKNYFYEGIAITEKHENISDIPTTHKKHKKLLIFSIIITCLLLIISLYFTVTNGTIAYTNNTGDLMDNTVNIDYEEFFISLAITIALVCVDIFLIILTVKINASKK